jgi:hypothetical protein
MIHELCEAPMTDDNLIPPAPQPQQPGQGQPAYGQQPYSPAGYPGYVPQPPRGLSITSMVLGIVGLLGSFVYGFGLFPAIAAVITGFIARKRQPHGRAFWLTGLITGWVAIAISTVWIIIIIIFFTVLINNPGFRNSVENGFQSTSGGY